MHEGATLLAPDEPPVFEHLPGDGRSPYVVTCDHAGRHIPKTLARLGLSEDDLSRHIAWDIGAAGLSRELAARLGAELVLQNYSRLVIDCNRSLGHPDSIATRSEATDIPGNARLSAEQAALRARVVFSPYHDAIRRALDARAANARSSVLVFVHSFTPVYLGQRRLLDAGVLHHADSRLAVAMLAALRREPGLAVGDNEPYRASALTDFSLIEHAERRGLAYVELEVRQDLIAEEAGQRSWADRLSRCLVEASGAADTDWKP